MTEFEQAIADIERPHNDAGSLAMTVEHHWPTIKAEIERLNSLINKPEVENFLLGTKIEAAHQIERWGTAHDRNKEPADWFWLVGYLAGKCLQSHLFGDMDKAKHHTISTAAALCQWHQHITGGTGSGMSDVEGIVAQAFGEGAINPSVFDTDDDDEIELNDCENCRHESYCINEDGICNEHQYAEPKMSPIKQSEEQD